MHRLIYIDEPTLLFNHDQPMLDPRDGLSLFGPIDRAKPEGIRWGAVGPKESIERLKIWVEKIQRPVVSGGDLIARPLFPGFEAAFHCVWEPKPVLEIVIPRDSLQRCAYLDDRHKRVYQTVDLYSARIKNALRTEEVHADLWCVVIPEYVYQTCRPESIISADEKVASTQTMTPKLARTFHDQASLFGDIEASAEEYLYEVNFHHQLKARLLEKRCPTQIIRETTIAHGDFRDKWGEPTRDLDDLESAIAWSLSTAVFYKAGGRPWKLGAAREGVCYLGLVFKKVKRSEHSKTACCAAQMFLDSGDGVVFKGAVGPWYRGKEGLFHLDRKSAEQVVKMCVEAYQERNEGRHPKELFIHGRVNLNNEEWAGFTRAVGKETRVVGVRIRPVNTLKLFRRQEHPVLRGIAFVIDEKKGYLWTRGLVPRLRTYVGREVPNPLLIDVCRGEADLRVVMSDILALTKLNYNACIYGDGLPVTLKFAKAVGEILTAGPARKLDVPPLPFKYYI